MLSQWLQKWLGPKSRTATVAGPRRRARSFRPRIEALEDRLAPAVIPVTTLTDGVPGSLRAAITLANTNPGPDTIVFNVTGTIALTGGTLTLTDGATTTIAGPGAGSLIVTGGNAFTVFDVAAGASAVINNITVTGGATP